MEGGWFVVIQWGRPKNDFLKNGKKKMTVCRACNLLWTDLKDDPFKQLEAIAIVLSILAYVGVLYCSAHGDILFPTFKMPTGRCLLLIGLSGSLCLVITRIVINIFNLCERLYPPILQHQAPTNGHGHPQNGNGDLN